MKPKLTPKNTLVKSYGIILVCDDKILLIQRKDSFGYLTCIDNVDINHHDVSETLETITLEEKEKLLKLDWDQLWQDAKSGNVNRGNKYKDACKARFEWLGIRETVQALDRRGQNWKTNNEWGLPKGRMSNADDEIGQRCALRELKEETGLRGELVGRNFFTDAFIGTDGKKYETNLYIGSITPALALTGKKQKHEIRKIEWCTVDECKERLRPSTFSTILGALTTINDRKPQQ